MSEEKPLSLTVKLWRQASPTAKGHLETHQVEDVSPDISFLELLDQINEGLEREGKEPVAFDHDCREGICGCCGLMVDGRAHGPEPGTTVCQLHMRSFKDGDTITVEPWRAEALPLIKDLIVDRSVFDGIMRSGGYISVNTGSAPDANTTPIAKKDAEAAMDFAACIGCGACVAACKNASAMLFVGAKVAQLMSLPQGRRERERRVLRMVYAMDQAGFGNCTNELECSAACPKEIPGDVIATLNREYLWAMIRSDEAERAEYAPRKHAAGENVGDPS